MISKIFIIGIGPGNPEYLTKKAFDALQVSDIVFGADRVLENLRGTFPSKNFVNEYRPEQIFEKLFGESQSDNAKSIDISISKKAPGKMVSICFSGSINLFSGASSAFRFFTEKGIVVEEIDGLSSVSYFLSRLRIPENEVKVVSLHGRECDVLSQIRTNKYTVVLLSDAGQLVDIAKSIYPEGELNKIKIFVGENLSLKDERITSGNPRNFVLLKPIKNALTIALFQNDNFDNGIGYFVKDTDFIRNVSDTSGKRPIPMTKESIRTLALEELELKTDSVLFDIGSGTGSVSIAAGKMLTEGHIFSFEKNPEAVILSEKNIKKHELSNVEVIKGRAPEIFDEINVIPTHAFIGGADKSLSKIITKLIDMNPDIRILITAVTLETISKCESLPDAMPKYDVSFKEISVTDYEMAGSYHIRKAQNPVMLVKIIKCKNLL